LTALVAGIGYVVGTALQLPGWSPAVFLRGVGDVFVAAGLTLALMPAVALAASAGRSYLPAFGWVILTIFLAQIVAATGWGDWFPWSVPALYSGIAGERDTQLGTHSYAVVVLALVVGTVGTFMWWHRADQAR
jgi:ABC-2 type transport system permease protein